MAKASPDHFHSATIVLLHIAAWSVYYRYVSTDALDASFYSGPSRDPVPSNGSSVCLPKRPAGHRPLTALIKCIYVSVFSEDKCELAGMDVETCASMLYKANLQAQNVDQRG